MVIELFAGRLRLLLLLVLLGLGCRQQNSLVNLLPPRTDVLEVDVVSQVEREGWQLVLFYYTDASGQRWLSVKEVSKTLLGEWRVEASYSALQVGPGCDSPCTTFKATRQRGRIDFVLYGYTTRLGTEEVAIQLADGRTLRAPIQEQAFITYWSGTGQEALHQSIEEIDGE